MVSHFHFLQVLLQVKKYGVHTHLNLVMVISRQSLQLISMLMVKQRSLLQRLAVFIYMMVLLEKLRRDLLLKVEVQEETMES